jgi:hypothetical protein
MSDVKCIKCNAETVPIGNDPEHGVIHRCLHNTDHLLAVIADDLPQAWVVEHPAGEPECRVFRCMARPSRCYSTDWSGRRIEMGVCKVHGAALDAGESWMRGPNGKVLMGEDYLVAKRRHGGAS